MPLDLQFDAPPKTPQQPPLPQPAPTPTPAPQPAPAAGGLNLQFDPSGLDQLRTPAMRQRVMRLAAQMKQPWQQVESQIAETAQQTGRPIDLLVGSMEQLNAPQQPPPMPGTQAASAAPAASQQAAEQMRQQGVPGPQRAGAAAQIEQQTAQGKPAVPPRPQGVAPQWMQNAALNLPKVAGQGFNELWNISFDRPLQKALWVAGRPAELTEGALTGGQGYDKTWLAHIQNPTERGLAAAVLKTALDPTNLLMFPGVTRAGITLGARVADVAEKAALAAREDPHIAQTVGVIERAMMEGKLAGAVKGTLAPKVNAAIDRMITAGAGLRRLFDVTANLPVEVKQAVREHIAGQSAAARQATSVLHDYWTMIPADSDRAMLHQVLEGTSAQQHVVQDAPTLYRTREALVTRELAPLNRRINEAQREMHTIQSIHPNPQRIAALERQVSALATETFDIGRTYTPRESAAIEREIKDLQDQIHVASGGGAIERRVDTLQRGIDKLRDQVKVVADRYDPAKVADLPQRRVQGVPLRLQKAMDSINALQDQQENRAVMGGIVSHTRDMFIKHLYPAADYRQAGRMGGDPTVFQAGAKQMLPRGPVWSTVIPSSMKRTFPTSVEARIAGMHPVLDVARSLAAHELEISLAENDMKMLDTIGSLGPEWVRSTANEAVAIPEDWVSARNLVGSRTAATHVLPNGERLYDLHFHPDIGALARELTGAREPNAALRNLTTASSAVKKNVFGFLPFFHGSNLWRSAYLADGMRVFDPRHWSEWRAAARDAREFGPDTQNYLADGGSMDTSAVSALRNTILEIMTGDPAKRALQASGIDWSKPVTVPKQVWGNFHQWGENLIWEEWDKGMRINIYNRLKQKGMSGPEAARQATLAMNDYSKTGMTRFERGLTNVFFTYAWQKGRMRLFGNMARSFSPFSDLSLTERAYMDGVVRRWAAANIVMPHLVRALEGRASAGVFGARIPIGTVQGPGGTRRPLYMNPGGFFYDGIDFITHPVNYALGHIGPLIQEAGYIVNAREIGYLTGRPTGKVLREETVSEAARTTPAGALTALRMLPDFKRDPVGTLLRMAAPFAGFSEYTTPPPPEDPQEQLMTAIGNHDYMGAAKIMRENHIGINRIKQGMGYEEGKKLDRAYSILGPHIGSIKQPRY